MVILLLLFVGKKGQNNQNSKGKITVKKQQSRI